MNKKKAQVRHKGESLTVNSIANDLVTVKSTVDDLIADYDNHRKQLEEFRASAD